MYRNPIYLEYDRLSIKIDNARIKLKSAKQELNDLYINSFNKTYTWITQNHKQFIIFLQQFGTLQSFNLRAKDFGDTKNTFAAILTDSDGDIRIWLSVTDGVMCVSAEGWDKEKESNIEEQIYELFKKENLYD